MVDITKVKAIDIHTHAEEPCGCHADDGYDELQAAMANYFGAPWKQPPTIPETAAHYREQNIAAVIFPVDAERETGYRRYANEEVAELAAENSDVLIPFASIDPHKGKMGVREARRLMSAFGIKGFKFHPTLQGFYPNDRMAYELYGAIERWATSTHRHLSAGNIQWIEAHAARDAAMNGKDNTMNKPEFFIFIN